LQQVHKIQDQEKVEGAEDCLDIMVNERLRRQIHQGKAGTDG
jgi:hypothetical protein